MILRKVSMQRVFKNLERNVFHNKNYMFQSSIVLVLKCRCVEEIRIYLERTPFHWKWKKIQIV